MYISNLKTCRDSGNVVLSVSIESEQFGRRELWFSTPEKFGSCLCKTRLDGFLVGMLFPAMCYGEDIHLQGCVSRKLLHNLNNYGIPLLKSFSPECKGITITADETSSERIDCNGVGAGFTGGVDSFCTIYDRHELETCVDYKVNTLVLLNVGSHGRCRTATELEFARDKFQRRYNYLKAFPEELGLDYIPLDSNLHSFYSWPHQKTHTLASAAGILAMQQCFSRYYYASSGIDYNHMMSYSIRYKDISVGAYCDPILLPLLSTESLDMISDGIQYARSAKMLRIMNYDPVRRFLNVCVSGDESHENCSVCSKCCKTLMFLHSAGRQDDFAHLFDIDRYKKMERRYVLHQVLEQSENYFARDNAEFARQNSFKLPSRPALFAAKLKAYRKTLKRRLLASRKSALARRGD